MPSPAQPLRRPSRTKIVATVGPACASPEKLAELVEAGVDVFRINTAHGSREEHQGRLDDVRRVSDRLGVPVAVLIDLAGPKMRLGEIPGDQLACTAGSEVRFIRGKVTTSPTDLVTTYDPLIDELQAGDRIMLADGIVALCVERVDRDAAVCRVIQGGVVRSRQGVNLPGVRLTAPAMSDRDRDNAAWAAAAGIDFIGMSFVRTAADVGLLRSIVDAAGSAASIIAKIEKPEAVENLDTIVAAADGIMVARGDLGVEIDIAEVPIVQKRIIAACHRARKPVIVATQMLDSMQHSRLPTRAESTDVANAILDGADACMLSGETAVGEYPRDAVEMMHRIALATEEVRQERSPQAQPDFCVEGSRPITEAITWAAGRIAEGLGAKMIVVATASGATALAISKHRNSVHTVGISDSEATLRRMCLYWGVVPVAGLKTDDGTSLVKLVIQRASDVGHLVAGDRVVSISGTGLRTSRHNMVVVHEVE
jgi:pyruvate kinase